MIIRMLLIMPFAASLLAPQAALAQAGDESVELALFKETYTALVDQLPPGEHIVIAGERGHGLPEHTLLSRPTPESVAEALGLSSSGHLDDVVVCTTEPRRCQITGGAASTLSFAVLDLDDGSAIVDLVTRQITSTQGILYWSAYTVALTRTDDGWRFERVISFREA